MSSVQDILRATIQAHTNDNGDVQMDAASVESLQNTLLTALQSAQPVGQTSAVLVPEGTPFTAAADASIDVQQALTTHHPRQLVLYFDAVAKGLMNSKLFSNQELTDHVDIVPHQGNRFKRPVCPTDPLAPAPLSALLSEPHTQRQFTPMATDYQIYANAYSQQFDVAAELAAHAVRLKGRESRAMHGLVARQFATLTQIDVRCGELHLMNHVQRDRAAIATNFIVKQDGQQYLSRPAPLHPHTLALEKHVAHQLARANTSTGGGVHKSGPHRGGFRGRKRRQRGAGGGSGSAQGAKWQVARGKR